MIELRDTPMSFACASCGKLSLSPLIEIGEDQIEMNSNPKLNLCDSCKEELARRILFRRSKPYATEQ